MIVAMRKEFIEVVGNLSFNYLSVLHLLHNSSGHPRELLSFILGYPFLITVLGFGIVNLIYF